MSNVKEQLVNEIFRPARKHFSRRRVVLLDVNELWQCDLVEMRNLVEENDDYQYILTVFCCFSKYAWAIPVKRKTGKSVTAAFEKILSLSRRKPSNIQVVQDSEFFNSHFRELMEKHGINLYHTNSEIKANFIERF